jgi:hypothetical protein
LLRFFKRGTVTGWLSEGTSKSAKRTPPIQHSNVNKRASSKAQVDAAVARAIAASERQKQR